MTDVSGVASVSVTKGEYPANMQVNELKEEEQMAAKEVRKRIDSTHLWQPKSSPDGSGRQVKPKNQGLQNN